MWGPSLRDIPKWVWPKRQAEEPKEREIRDLVCGETAYVPHWAYDARCGLDTTFPVMKHPFGTSQMRVKRVGRKEFEIDEAETSKSEPTAPLSKAERGEMRQVIHDGRSESFGSYTPAVLAAMDAADAALDACDALSAGLEELARVKDRYQVLAAERQYELAQLRALHGRL